MASRTIDVPFYVKPVLGEAMATFISDNTMCEARMSGELTDIMIIEVERNGRRPNECIDEATDLFNSIIKLIVTGMKEVTMVDMQKMEVHPQ